MNFDWTVNLTSLLALLFAAGGAVAAWVKIGIRLDSVEKKIDDQEEKIEHYRLEMAGTLEAINAKLAFNHERIMETLGRQARELGEFQVHVARNHPGNTALEKTEERLVRAIEELGRRIVGPH